MKKTVPYITGDGVGVEITPAMQAIVNAAVKKAYGNEHEIEWMEVLAGERALAGFAASAAMACSDIPFEYYIHIQNAISYHFQDMTVNCCPAFLQPALSHHLQKHYCETQ